MSHVQRFAALVLTIATLTCFVDSTSAAAFKNVHEGDEAPAFTLPAPDGNPVELTALHGEGPLTILVFWATWNPNSAPQLADVQKLVDAFGDKGLKAVAVNAEGAEAPPGLETLVKTFLEEHKIGFPVALDKELAEYNGWGVVALPATAFLDRERKVVYEFSGHPTSAYEDMEGRVRELLGLQEAEAAAEKPKHERYHADKKVQLNYGLARTQFERGQFSKALGKLKKVLEEDPNFPDAHALDGLIHLGLEAEDKEGAGDRARQAFQKAVELDAALPAGLAGLAHFALADGDVAKALELTRATLEHTEEEEIARLWPAAAQSAPPEQGQAQERAQGDGAAAADPAALVDRAAAALEAGKTDEAKDELGPVIETLLGVPEGPGSRARKMLEQMQKK
jgi:peroxiredoxin